jgi:chemotaxis protein MotA
MDLATILGLLAGLMLVGTAMVLGGSPTSFIDGPAFLIVIGGTLAVTTICFSFQEMLRAQGIIVKTLFYHGGEPRQAATRMLRLAETARKETVLTMQDKVEGLRNTPFLHKAMSLVIDGVPGDEVERILGSEIAAMSARHAKGASVLRKAAEVSPAMGLIGTLVGLVQMLGNLEDPSTIGPSMAVALLTTFYGALLANMVFSPLASKLERNSDEEMLLNTVYRVGAVSISRQENPRRLEMLLNAALPPPQRVTYFD